MSFTRRNFLIGAGSGLSLLVVTACTDGTPAPTLTPTPTPTGTVPPPKAMYRSSWSTDSFSRGSHSFFAVGSTPQDREALAEPVLDRVFFAGEATARDNPATVLGAQQSGARASIQVANVAGQGDRIAVVGAGAAGAEAARLLTLRGYDVVVVEARDRTGGRIHSLQAEDFPVPVELGAWALRETRDAELLADLARLEIDTVPLGDESLYRSTDAETSDNPAGREAIATALAWAAEQPTDVALANAIEESGAAAEAEGTTVDGVAGPALIEQGLVTASLFNGAPATLASAWFEVEHPDEERRAVTGGYSRYIEETLDGVETYLSTTVVGIAYDETGASLRLGTGESLSVDRVIVTVPLGVLQEGIIEFDPMLPFSHRSAISALGVGTVETVWLAFDEPFWSTDASVWHLVGTDHDLTVWINLEPFTGEPVLLGVAGGDVALRMAELDDEQLVAAAISSLEIFSEGPA